MQGQVKHSQKGPFCSHSSIVSIQILKIVLHHAYYICFSTFVWENNCKLFSNQHLFLMSPTQFLLLKLTIMHIYLLMSLIVSVYLKVEILQLITDFRCLCVTTNSLSLFKQKHFKGINPLWGFLYKYCANSPR